MQITTRGSVTGLAALALAVGLALGGCGDSGDNTASSADQPVPGAGQPAGAGEVDKGRVAPPAAAQPPAGQPGAGQPGAGEPGAGQADRDAPARYLVDERAVIYTGSISVRVPDVAQAATAAATIATGAGGFVGADKRTSDDQRGQATLQLRVPAERFGAVVERLSGLGREESRDTDAQDVTEEVVDLDARIATAQASVNRTRALFAQARTIGEIVSVETELARREADLASLQARKRKLDDLTALSTITVILSGPQAPPSATDDPGFLAGLGSGWSAFLGAVRVLLTVLGFLLPFAVVVSVPAGLAWWLLRRRRHRAAATGTGSELPQKAG